MVSGNLTKNYYKPVTKSKSSKRYTHTCLTPDTALPESSPGFHPSLLLCFTSVLGEEKGGGGEGGGGEGGGGEGGGRRRGGRRRGGEKGEKKGGRRRGGGEGGEEKGEEKG